MRMSCNGCRVLRKGCSDNCSIRPCLQWIKNPESQAHATVFLAKFYGRAGLMNLVNAGPDHLRPAIFRSLLYEACGRIVNPIYGSVGLLWSGSWPLCQAAVEAVLKGEPIVTIPTETAASNPVPPFKAYDIRHVTKNSGSGSDPLKVTKTRNRFKRSANNNNNIKRVVNLDSDPSHDSSNGGGVSHVTEQGEIESGSSVGGEASHVSTGAEESDVELELTLGLAGRVWHPARAVSEGARTADTCGVELGL